MSHRIAYSDGVDTVVLEVPWESHSGNIPPPVIEFGTRRFVYQGDPGVATLTALSVHRS